MKQAALIILVTLLVLAGGTVFLNKQLQKQPAPAGQMEQTYETVVQPTLTLTPQDTQAAVGDQVTYTVSINPAGNQVVGVETYLMYDTDMLSNITLAPGTFFAQPEELLNFVDTSQGKISYALGTLTPQLGEGQVFTITATLTAAPLERGKVLWFDQNNTKVALFGPDGKERFDESQTKILYNEIPISVLSL